MQRIIRPAAVALTAGVALAAAGAARAALVDLSTANASGTINGASFDQGDLQPAGTGFINSFVRIQNNGIEQGYNTSIRPVAFDEKTDGNFTRFITYGEVPTVMVGGVAYKQFFLDINQEHNVPNNLLSLDKLKIWTKQGQLTENSTNVGPDNATATQTGASGSTGFGTLRYNMDQGGDNEVLLNATLSHGSGQSDMFLNVPVSFFGNTADSDFLTLYSLFGVENQANATFEEWAIQEATPLIPLPAAAWMGIIGLGTVGVTRRLRR
jgi:hypothetical protein